MSAIYYLIIIVFFAVTQLYNVKYSCYITDNNIMFFEKSLWCQNHIWAGEIVDGHIDKDMDVTYLVNRTARNRYINDTQKEFVLNKLLNNGNYNDHTLDIFIDKYPVIWNKYNDLLNPKRDPEFSILNYILSFFVSDNPLSLNTIKRTDNLW